MKKSALQWIGIILLIQILYSLFFTGQNNSMRSIPMSELIKTSEDGSVASVDIAEDVVYGTSKKGEKFKSNISPYYIPKIVDSMQKGDVKINVVKKGDNDSAVSKVAGFIGNFLSWLPIIFMTLMWIIIFKQISGSKGGSGGFGGPFSFGKSKAKAISPKDIKTRFKDVAGIDEARGDLEEIVDFLKHTEKYKKIGGKNTKRLFISWSAWYR